MELEDRLTVPGAEGLDLDLVLAGVGSRSVALLVDLVIQALLAWLAVLIAANFGDAGAAISFVVVFAVVIGYHVAFETLNRGRTPGKALIGVSVVSADGSPVRFLASLIRNVVRFIDLLPGTYTVGLVAVLATPANQRLGDLTARTLVIRTAPSAAQVPSVPVPSASSGSSVPSDSSVPGGGAVAGAGPSAAGPVGAGVGAPEGSAGWDVASVSAEEVAAVQAFLGRRASLDATARAQLADTFSRQLFPKVAGVPLDGGPEAFLERVVAAKQHR